MKAKNKKLFSYCCAVLLGFYGAIALALETDKDQPINIDSNTATYDDTTGTSIYTGSVVSIQGSMRVDSDKLVVYFKDGEAEKLVFTGNRAKFKQTPKEGEKDITGEALTGEYYPKKNLLVLIEEATVWQGTGTYTSRRIEYDSKTSVVRAGDNTSASKRVHVVIKPESKEKKPE